MVEISMRSLTLISNRLYFANLAEVARTHPPLVEGLRRRDPQVADEFHDHALVIWLMLSSGQADGKAQPKRNEPCVPQ